MKTVTRPIIPSTVEIYDQIMGSIEPDLVSKKVPTLAKKYAGESAAEHKKRMERYKKAFESYSTAMKKYFAELNKKVDQYRKVVMKSAEVKSRGTETRKLSFLESLFSS